jgi:hypothetical protein
MKHLALIFTMLLALAPTGAWAQCNGVFPAKTICGNNSTSPGIPGQVPQSALTGIPGGSPGQIQYNAAGSFAGFTMSGDCTINTSTGVITCAGSALNFLRGSLAAQAGAL